VDITMPQLGETVTEGTITRWLKQIGDRVETDEPLFEVSTDKVDSEVPAPAGGFLTEIRVPEGEAAAVGTVLAVVGDVPGAAAPTEETTATGAVVAPAPPPFPQPAPQFEPVVPPPAPEPPPPEPEPTLPPAPPGPTAPSTPVAPGVPAGQEAALTSPVVRRLVAEHGLDVSQIQGTGEGGRITRRDVLGAAAARAIAPGPVEPPAVEARPATAATPPNPVPPPTPAPSPPTTTAAPEPPPTPAPASLPSAPPPTAPAQPSQSVRSDEVVAFSRIRRRTGEHMLRSKATSAHVYTSVEVDFERVSRVREHRQDSWQAREGFSLTYLPFVARAVADAIGDFPNLNASVADDTLVVHRDVHLGIAVDLNFQGLVAPVVRNADGKRLRLLAREIRDLAERARTKQLMPDEVLGGTFTITNPGPFGTYMTLPIINQPQVAILSTDGVSKKPVVVSQPDGSDVIAVHRIGILVLTWDHRAFDGAYAAAFLRALKQDLETRDWEAELA
jgi:pyruvate dehydrogenase E2 component (dihydrolipoamide acetyltransferase)